MVVVISDYVEETGTHTPSQIGVEETVWRYESSAPAQIQGFLNTMNMVDEDVIIIREYISFVHPVVYQLLTERTLFGKQKEPLWLCKLLWVPRGYKITLTQTIGSPKAYPYYFVIQKVERR